MYRRILVPLDGSRLSEAALGQLPNLVGSDTEVILLRVVGDETTELPPTVLAPAASTTGYAAVVPPVSSGSDPDQLSDEGADRSRDAAQRYLDETALALRSTAKVRTTVAAGADPAQLIADQATAEGADLILMSTHGRSGVIRLVLGSIAERVLRATELPVLVIRPKA
jgi:nucleotide-binding universal stress UspA family protein